MTPRPTLDEVSAAIKEWTKTSAGLVDAAHIGSGPLFSALRDYLPDADERTVGAVLLAASLFTTELVAAGCDDPCLVVNIFAYAGMLLYSKEEKRG